MVRLSAPRETDPVLRAVLSSTLSISDGTGFAGACAALFPTSVSLRPDPEAMEQQGSMLGKRRNRGIVCSTLRWPPMEGKRRCFTMLDLRAGTG
jgi:hypothetical protein